ncbi:DUF3592 domain-containing protein [Tenacibaculum sp. S7007]|uniref:DUF3592 domain-containing protein n=1 Tax=Tenacibaculum pelagium TaxID=2759527 RepID=A0A839ALY5_9FLAO|nr:DUF3592 domain-containing protein [Tenacibaculum pelagium]MBA6156132.1 DUF3592 domain-containing protein [Tenacibaculum pelagium]
MYKQSLLKKRLIIGCIFLCISFGVYRYNKFFRENANKTIGVIVDYDTSVQDDGSIKKFPIFEYTSTKGNIYQHKVIASRDEVIVGDRDVVYYDKDNPDKALIGDSNFDFFSFISLAIGLVLLISYFFVLIKNSLSNAKLMNLKLTGKKVIIPHDKVFTVRFYSDDSVYYKIFTQLDDVKNNKVHLFKSLKLKNDPKDEIKRKNIALYLNTNNYKKYEIDLNFLNEFNG